jgi:nucleoside 2-deoxyribosyltransferase
LAGPDVFFPDCQQLAARKREICARHGLRGHFPLDDLPDVSGLSELDFVDAIYGAQARKIVQAPIVIANLTPWPNRNRLAADTGTAYECGFAAGFNAALQAVAVSQPRKILLCYSNEVRPWSQRLTAITGVTIRTAGLEQPRDDEGFMVDTLGRPENLMLEGGARTTGGAVLVPSAPVPEAEYYTYLGVFEQAATLAARLARAQGLLAGAA